MAQTADLGDTESKLSGVRGPLWSTCAPLLLLCLLLAVASFLKTDRTRNDFERFDDVRLLWLFFVLLGSCASVYLGLYTRRLRLSWPSVAITVLLASGFLWASFPVGSKDVFGYAFYGKMWGLYGANPYLQAPAAFPNDPWQAYLQVRWRDLPTAYGPLFLWQARAIYAVGGDHLWVAVWLHKLVATAVFLAVLLVAERLVRRDAYRVALLALNPLFLFESAGNGHNDVAMVLFLVVALWCWQQERRVLAYAVLALSFWYKWYSLLFLGAFLVEACKQRRVRPALIGVVVATAGLVGFGVVLLAPLPGSFPVLLQALLHPGAMRGIYPNELSPVLAVLFWPAYAAGWMETSLGARLFDAARYGLFAVVVVAALVRQWRAQPSLEALVESCFLIASAFFLLLVTMLLPWHLLTVIALGILCKREQFVTASVLLTVLALLSYFLTFAVATLGMGLIVAALWLLRRAPGNLSLR